MTVYRIKYYRDVECKEEKFSKDFRDFKEMKEMAKKLSKLTQRSIEIQWCYDSNYGMWQLLRYCPNEKDINNVKIKN